MLCELLLLLLLYITDCACMWMTLFRSHLSPDCFKEFILPSYCKMQLVLKSQKRGEGRKTYFGYFQVRVSFSPPLFSALSLQRESQKELFKVRVSFSPPLFLALSLQRESRKELFKVRVSFSPPLFSALSLQRSNCT